jgi:hypothetical protein
MLNTRSIVSAKQHGKEIIHTSQDFLEIQVVLLLIYLPGRQYTRGTRSSVNSVSSSKRLLICLEVRLTCR